MVSPLWLHLILLLLHRLGSICAVSFFFSAFKVFPLPLLSSVLACQLRLWLQLFLHLSLLPTHPFISVLAPLLSLVLLSFSLGSSTPASSSVIPFVAFVPLPPLSFRCQLLYFLRFLLCFLGVLLLQLHLLSSLLSPHFLSLLQCHLRSFVPTIPRSSADVSSVQGFSSAFGGGGGCPRQVHQILILSNFHAPLALFSFVDLFSFRDSDFLLLWLAGGSCFWGVWSLACF